MEAINGDQDQTEDAKPKIDTCNCHKKKLLQLEKRVRMLEDVLQDKDAIISNLKAKNKQVTAELVEYQLQNLQKALSEKDSSLAAVELKLKQSGSTDRKQTLAHVKSVLAERNQLAQQFKSKINERFELLRKDSDEVLGAVAKEYRSCSRSQLCNDLRTLDLSIVRLKSYIDQLLAVALESNPSLLEGMPRIQQNSGLKMELFSIATLTELLEELHEREKNRQNLQDYASLLLHRLTEHGPQLLDSVLIPKWEDMDKAHTSSISQHCSPRVSTQDKRATSPTCT